MSGDLNIDDPSDGIDLPAPCSQIELITTTRQERSTSLDHRLGKASLDPYIDEASCQVSEILVVCGQYIFWHQVTRSSAKVKCLALTRLKHPIRNIMIKDELLLVTDT